MDHLPTTAPGLPAANRHLSILVVQPDDPADCTLLREVVRRHGALVAWERNLRCARQALASTSFDIVLTADRLPDGAGLSLVADRADRIQRWATILLTGCADTQSVSSAIARGAFDVVERSVGAQRLLDLISDAVAGGRPKRTLAAVRGAGIRHGEPAEPADEPLLGDSLSMQRLRKQVQRVAGIPTDVLVIGETGSGKDLAVQHLHALSGRRGALVALNCGAIPDTLFESELFGHEAGSFTGAAKSQAGKIEQAHQGTLFLDEIDSMPLNQQVKLLRVLETRRVARVGGRGDQALDLRIVAAVQRRLDERCRQGLFRLDLWHRLDVVTLEITPLRDRREDVVPLFQHYRDEACRRFGIEPGALPEPDWGVLTAHGWPGNVRELKHAAARSVLGLKVLPDEPGAAEPTQGLLSQLGQCERELIRAALVRHGRRPHAVAAELGISEKTLSRRIAAFGLASDALRTDSGTDDSFRA
jgi:two-component system, NtrC family, C4-dicarboxylate transport response regulator DctD